MRSFAANALPRGSETSCTTQHRTPFCWRSDPNVCKLSTVSAEACCIHLSVSLTLAVNASRRPPFWPSAARWFASGVNSLVHFVPLLLVSPFSRDAAWAIYRNWGRIAYRIFGITLSLEDDNQGNPGPEPHLYVWLNQSTLAEIFVLPQLLPPHYGIANIEYAAMPLVGWALALLRYIVIVRQWKSQARRGIDRAAARLAHGEVWAMSIEGARSLDGNLLPYKKGPIVLAIRSEATIIPMIIHGGREIMPRGDWRVRRGHITLHLLTSLPTRGLTYDSRDEVLSRLRELAERELALVVLTASPDAP